MANVVITPSMKLPVPVVGTESGPQWATDINSCLTIIDQHNHTPGYGVQLTPLALNINSDLTFQDNNLTNARSLRLYPQSANLSGSADIGCLYESGVDLYYNDGNGNQVRITQSGAVAGTPGSISNLVSPASAAYVAANQTFVWQSDVLTPANLDAASVILRNLSASSKGLTLNPPNSMAADYNITLPTLPASTLPVSISVSGAMSAAQIATAQIATNAITYSLLSSQVQTYVRTTPITVMYTSGSGTYTPTANVTYLKIKMVGGGGGGGGTTTAGVAGGATTFGSAYLIANGGQPGAASTLGGAGGSVGATPGGLTGVFLSGASGGSANNGVGSFPGGSGAATPFGGGGGGGIGNSAHPSASAYGAGGGGAGGISGSTFAGSGGGSGAYIEVTIPSPSASYAYSVGASGSGGGGGAGGSNGGSGVIIIEEHFGS